MPLLEESPHIQWFEEYGKCRCGSRAAGILRGTRNESYGEHCKKCAERRLATSRRVRQQQAILSESSASTSEK